MLKLLGVLVVIATGSWVLADVSECVGKCPSYSSADSPIHFLPHENCNMYCVCSYGKPTEMPCPADLHFSPTLHNCVDPTLAECANYHPDYLINPGDTEKNDDLVFVDDCIGECNNGEDSNEIILLAHANSSMYCRCRNGRAMIKRCSAGYIFNSEEGTCMPQNEADY